MTISISPDQTVLFHLGPVPINVTIIMTWGLMAALTFLGRYVTKGLISEGLISKQQGFLEAVVSLIKGQIEDIGLRDSERYIPFLASLFLFIATANCCTIVPGYTTPTSSLSTTAALAILVFLSVIYFGIREHGFFGYLKTYIQPTWIMLPFNIISEVSRTLALAVRLFGNMMSGEMVVSILLIITPLFFPIVMNLLGLVIGMVQAYIFTVLAAVYIAAATQES